jgi:hypothetical protein
MEKLSTHQTRGEYVGKYAGGREEGNRSNWGNWKEKKGGKYERKGKTVKK